MRYEFSSAIWSSQVNSLGDSPKNLLGDSPEKFLGDMLLLSRYDLGKLNILARYDFAMSIWVIPILVRRVIKFSAYFLIAAKFGCMNFEVTVSKA